jgi:hypothetical protein
MYRGLKVLGTNDYLFLRGMHIMEYLVLVPPRTLKLSTYLSYQRCCCRQYARPLRLCQTHVGVRSCGRSEEDETQPGFLSKAAPRSHGHALTIAAETWAYKASSAWRPLPLGGGFGCFCQLTRQRDHLRIDDGYCFSFPTPLSSTAINAEACATTPREFSGSADNCSRAPNALRLPRLWACPVFEQ